MIYCDRCDDAYHGSCLHPPLGDLPTSSEAWFCARCPISLIADKNFNIFLSKCYLFLEDAFAAAFAKRTRKKAVVTHQHGARSPICALPVTR
jgi:hypothetical protein